MNEYSSTSEEKEMEEKTIEVRGFDPVTTDDAIKCHFENPRRGGGDIVKFKRQDNSVIFITFANVEVARQVVDQTNTIGKRDVQVTFVRTPPKSLNMYTDRLLIKGIKPGTTKEILMKYLEERSQGHVKDCVVFDVNEGRAVVIFDEMPDPEKLQAEYADNLLEGSELTISNVPVSNIVIVRGLKYTSSYDTVWDYFEGRRSGNLKGVEVVNVCMDTNAGYCLVYFKDHSVIDVIVGANFKKVHELDDSTLNVSIYYECLGGLCNFKPTSFEMPGLHEVKNMNRFKLRFIKDSKASMKGLQKVLERCNAKLSWPQSDNSSVKLTCTLTSDVEDAHLCSRTWATNAERVLHKYLDSLEVETIHILQNCYDEVIKKLNATPKDGVRIFSDKGCSSVVVVKHSSFGQKLVEDVRCLVKNVEIKYDRQKEEKVIIVINVDSLTLSLLQRNSFPKQMHSKFPGLTVDINVQKGEISFQGSNDNIDTAEKEMYKYMCSIKTSSKKSKLSDAQLQLVNTKGFRDQIEEKLKNKNLVGVWKLSDITTMAFSDTDADDIANIIETSVAEKKVVLHPEALVLFLSQKWTKFMTDLSAKYGDGMTIIHEDGSNCLSIVARDDVITKVKEEVDRFFEVNAIFTENLMFSKGVDRFLQQHCRKEIIQISSDLKCQEVQICVQNTSTGVTFTISGTKIGIEGATKALNDLASKVVQKVYAHKKPGIRKLLKSKRANEFITGLESRETCVIEIESDNAHRLNERYHQENTASAADNIQRDMMNVDVGPDADATDEKLETNGALMEPVTKRDSLQQDKSDVDENTNPSAMSTNLTKEQIVESQDVVFDESCSTHRPNRKNRNFDNPFMTSCGNAELCGESVDGDNLSEVTVTYFSNSRTHIDQCIQEIENYYGQESTTKTITDPCLRMLNPSQIKQVKNLENSHHVKTTCEQNLGKLHIEGLKQDVSDASDKVNKLLRIENKRQMVELLSNQVQWYFKDTDDQGQEVLTAYDKDVNGVIEKEHYYGSPQVTLAAGRYKYIIDFSTMEEYADEDRSDRVKIVRESLIRGEHGLSVHKSQSLSDYSTFQQTDCSGAAYKSLPDFNRSGTLEPELKDVSSPTDSNEGYKRFRDNFTFLLANTDGRAMCPKLYELRVIELSFMEEINAMQSIKARTELVINLLQRKCHDDETVYSSFLEALSYAKHKKALNKLNSYDGSSSENKSP